MTSRKSRVVKAANAYWQDKLAKFFPTLNGSSGCEIDMYCAGYAAGASYERRRIMRELKNMPAYSVGREICHDKKALFKAIRGK